MGDTNRGYIDEAFGAFHVRYRAEEIVDGKLTSVQRSHRFRTKEKGVIKRSASCNASAELMATINAQVPRPQGVSRLQGCENRPFGFFPGSTRNHPGRLCKRRPSDVAGPSNEETLSTTSLSSFISSTSPAPGFAKKSGNRLFPSLKHVRKQLDQKAVRVSE